MFRSGSCAERGPKQFMEDEHICIDNLIEHLGATANFPSPGAFYGVSFDITTATDGGSVYNQLTWLPFFMFLFFLMNIMASFFKLVILIS